MKIEFKPLYGIVSMLLLLAGCKAMLNYDSHIPYRIQEDIRNMGDIGDYTKLKFVDDDILVTCWFHNGHSKYGTVLEAGILLTAQQTAQLEGKKIAVVSANLGELDFVSYQTKGKYVDYEFLKTFDSLDRKTIMNRIAKDTIRVFIGDETYAFLSERTQMIE